LENTIENLFIEITEKGIDEFIIKQYDAGNLLIIGSPNIYYYHEVEIYFVSVSYINCPTSFSSLKNIRLAENDERNKYKEKLQLWNEDLIVIIEDTFGEKYYVVCEGYEYKFETVNHEVESP
jgi:hypothetical protein